MKFKFQRDKDHFVIARGVLRILLGKYLNLVPEKVQFAYSKYGKPKLADESNISFNLSHAQGKALLGFCITQNIGVDIECFNQELDFSNIANAFFSTAEAEQLNSLTAMKKAEAFFNCWTRKEAFIKAEGSGLSFPLKQFEVSLVPGEPVKLINTFWNPAEKENWSLYSFQPFPNFIGAVAIRRKKNILKFWDYHLINSL